MTDARDYPEAYQEPEPTFFTRRQYLNHECSHREYYAQFVTNATKRRVFDAFGGCEIASCASEVFTEIPLDRWDRVTRGMIYSLKNLLLAGDQPTPAGLVCIAKEAAAQIRDEIANDYAKVATSFGQDHQS